MNRPPNKALRRAWLLQLAFTPVILLFALGGLARPGHSPGSAGLSAQGLDGLGHTPYGRRGVSAPPTTTPLRIAAIGAWAGDFAPDEAGRGGLAALHAYISALRTRSAAEGGAALLVQAGDFSGARDAQTLRQKLVYPELNLIDYLDFDALGPTAAEVLSFAELGGPPRLRRAPTLSWNFRGGELGPRGEERPAQPGAPGVPSYRIANRGGPKVWITALQNGDEPRFARDERSLLERMRRGMESQDGAALYLLLLEDSPLPESVALRDTLFPIEPGYDPYTIPEQEDLATRMLMIVGGAERNSFERLPEGPYVCRIAGRSVCEIVVELRDDRPRALRARFIDLNANDSVDTWRDPDPLLQRILLRAEREANAKNPLQKEPHDNERDSHEKAPNEMHPAPGHKTVQTVASGT